jgi:DNA-directed RNA polymerase specialized sigma24 family protein
LPSDDSVSQWLDGLKAGEGADIQRLWDRYFHRLVQLASARLPAHARRVFDEEDIALSAFHSFCDRVGRGQFPELTDRDDLWRLLATITSRKAIHVLRHQNRAKRGGGQVLGESALMGGGGGGTDAPGDGIAGFLSREPTPEDAARFADDCAQLFHKLEDDTLKQIAQRRLEGHESAEIARELGVSTRTIDRKLRLIREIWSEESAG